MAACGLAEWVAARGMLDLGDLGAKLSKQHRRQRRSDHCAEIQHLESVQRQVVQRHGLAGSDFAEACRA